MDDQRHRDGRAWDAGWMRRGFDRLRMLAHWPAQVREKPIFDEPVVRPDVSIVFLTAAQKRELDRSDFSRRHPDFTKSDLLGWLDGERLPMLLRKQGD